MSSNVVSAFPQCAGCVSVAMVKAATLVTSLTQVQQSLVQLTEDADALYASVCHRLSAAEDQALRSRLASTAICDF